MAKSLEYLTEALRRLPGVGPKSAQRMAFHLLQHDREGAAMLMPPVRGTIRPDSTNMPFAYCSRRKARWAARSVSISSFGFR